MRHDTSDELIIRSQLVSRIRRIMTPSVYGECLGARTHRAAVCYVLSRSEVNRVSLCERQGHPTLDLQTLMT